LSTETKEIYVCRKHGCVVIFKYTDNQELDWFSCEKCGKAAISKNKVQLKSEVQEEEKKESDQKLETVPKTDICPICNTKVTFSNIDGEKIFYICPKCGLINLAKEKWRKMLQDHKIEKSKPIEFHLSCSFCKHRASEKCENVGIDPTVCEKYEEDTQISNAEKVILLIQAQEPILFKDQYKTGCVYIEDAGIWKTFVINSKGFKFYISKLFFKALGKVLTSEHMKNAVRTIESFAREGKIGNLQNRIATIQTKQGPEVWFDMCDERWRSIRVNKDGWQIIEKTPPIFKKYNHQLPLYEPKNDNNATIDVGTTLLHPPLPLSTDQKNRGGIKSVSNTSIVTSETSKPLDQLFRFINIQEKDRILFKCILISYCISNYPHVVTAIIGDKGSCKSSFFKIFRSLIDPTIIEKLNLPRKTAELFQIIDHHYLCFFDNINYISREQSDVFCRVATGIGLQKRELYSDDEDIVRQLLRCVGLNGINIATTQEDLLDRTVLITFLPIPEGSRKTEEQLYREFEEVRPYIFGEMLDVLSKTLKLLPKIKPKKLFRMADFCKIGCAVAVALGYKQEDFLDAYEGKVKDQVKEAVYNSILGNVLLDFMSTRYNWIGIASSLFKMLIAHAKELGVSTRVKEFPKAPNILTRRMKLLLDSFKALDIEINFLADGHRTIEIWNHNIPAPPEVTQKSIENNKNVPPATSVTSATKVEGFQTQCFDCGVVLKKNEVYSHGGNHFCRKCRLKIEDQKKKEE